MPNIQEARPEWKTFTGKQLRNTELGHLIDNDEDIYKAKVAVKYDVNHYNRMKEAYRTKGWHGAFDYMAYVLRKCGLSDAEITKLVESKIAEKYN